MQPERVPTHVPLSEQTPSQRFDPESTLPPLSANATLQPFGDSVRTVAPASEAAHAVAVEARIDPLTVEQMDLYRRRLRYLCQLIRNARLPLCPINGVLFTAPIELASSARMQRLFSAFQQDVKQLHRELRMVFPLIAVFLGLERIPGFQEFASRVERRVRQSRAGSRFPMGHEVDDGARAWVVGRSIDWFRSWVYTEFSKDHANPGNARLYRLLCNLDDYRQRLMGLLKALFTQVLPDEPVRLAGCYFGACDADPKKQAFMEALLPRLIEEQDQVAWTATAFDADDRCRRRAHVMFFLAAVLIVANAALIFWYK